MEETVKIGTIPAKQARAQRTMERVERAARELLNQKSWADITMSELAKAAEASVGSIYARFESKAALLDRLDEIYCNEIIALHGELLSDAHDISFANAISGFVFGLADYHHANQGLIRTLILETRTAGHSNFHARSKRMNKGLKLAQKRLIDIVAAEGRDTPPERMAWTLFLVLSALRELTLFPQGLPRPASSVKTGAAEVVAMAMRYLQ